jgi:hypothetical protein
VGGRDAPILWRDDLDDAGPATPMVDEIHVALDERRR